MSPVNAMERSYAPIKDMLRRGIFAPGARLEATRLANDLGVSMTPVRDALHQLAGERLVDARVGNGFHVPRFSQSGLRELYEWNSALMTFAVRTVNVIDLRAFKAMDATAADRLLALIEHIAALTPNREMGFTLRNASDRVQQFRVHEQQIFSDMDAELAELQLFDTKTVHLIRAFYMRRMRASGKILLHRDRSAI